LSYENGDQLMASMRGEQTVEAFHEPALGARTALSARITALELADKAVRAPVHWFMASMRDLGIVETSLEPTHP